jgi:hypothetical protein
MVSKAKVDLPEPETPEMTVIWSRGILTSILRKLFWLAPFISISLIQLLAVLSLDFFIAVFFLPFSAGANSSFR